MITPAVTKKVNDLRLLRYAVQWNGAQSDRVQVTDSALVCHLPVVSTFDEPGGKPTSEPAPR